MVKTENKPFPSCCLSVTGSKIAREDVDGSISDNAMHIKAELTALHGYRSLLSHEGRAALRTLVGPGKLCTPKNSLMTSQLLEWVAVTWVVITCQSGQ